MGNSDHMTTYTYAASRIKSNGNPRRATGRSKGRGRNELMGGAGATEVTPGFLEKPVTRDVNSYMTVVSGSHYESTLDAVYVYEVPWSESPIAPSYPHYPQEGALRVRAT